MIHSQMAQTSHHFIDNEDATGWHYWEIGYVNRKSLPWRGCFKQFGGKLLITELRIFFTAFKIVEHRLLTETPGFCKCCDFLITLEYPWAHAGHALFAKIGNISIMGVFHMNRNQCNSGFSRWIQSSAIQFSISQLRQTGENTILSKADRESFECQQRKKVLRLNYSQGKGHLWHRELVQLLRFFQARKLLQVVFTAWGKNRAYSNACSVLLNSFETSHEKFQKWLWHKWNRFVQIIVGYNPTFLLNFDFVEIPSSVVLHDIKM